MVIIDCSCRTLNSAGIIVIVALFDDQLALKLARRACQIAPEYFVRKLQNPIFVVGFNNSGKSSAVRMLSQINGLNIYPGEGNGDLWFRGHFPWIESQVSVQPIWVSPGHFIQSVKDGCGNSFSASRAQLGAYQWLTRGSNLLNDSGMLAALAPDVVSSFPDGKFIHFIRDGRLASYITARLEWSRIIRSPGKYIEYDCPLRFFDVLRKMAEYWVWTMERMDLLSDFAPESVVELRYEDWWLDPDYMVDAVASFLGMAAPNVKEQALKGDLTEHLLSEIPATELAMLNEILGPSMIKKGYTLS